VDCIAEFVLDVAEEERGVGEARAGGGGHREGCVRNTVGGYRGIEDGDDSRTVEGEGGKMRIGKYLTVSSLRGSSNEIKCHAP
jgi:hypothetical protein